MTYRLNINSSYLRTFKWQNDPLSGTILLTHLVLNRLPVLCCFTMAFFIKIYNLPRFKKKEMFLPSTTPKLGKFCVF